MGLINSPLCRRCGAEDETSVHILCECEALDSLIHAYLGSFVFGPRGYCESKPGGQLELQQKNRAPLIWYQIMGHKGPASRPRRIRIARARTQLLIYSNPNFENFTFLICSKHIFLVQSHS